MRIAVVGAGSIGRRHIGTLLSLGCVVPVMDVSEAARARVQAEHPTALVSERLTCEGLDALVIATPCDRHLEWVEEAVRRKLPCFIEKPLGTLDQLPRWRALSQQAIGLITQVGYNWRFESSLLALRAVAATGGDWAAAFYSSSDLRTWPGQSYGDPFLETSHALDLATSWLRRPITVASAQMTDGVVLVTLIGADGHAIQVETRWGGWPDAWRSMEVFTDTGTWSLQPSEESRADSYRAELAHFVACVREHQTTDVPLAKGLDTLELCAEILAQAKAAA